MKKILVVGIENTCRSIIASEYLKKAVIDKGKSGIEVSCAGVRAFPDIPADPAAVAGLKTLGIEGEFKSKPLSKQEVAEAGIIVTMEPRIKGAIAGKFPDKAPVIFTLKELAGEGDSEITTSVGVATEIKGMIDKCIEKITGE
jgi:protein-tyrosine-phosphatase